MSRRGDERGFALVSVMLLVALVLSLLVAYYALTRMEMSSTRSSMSSVQGLYAAEAGLNVRADLVRQTFEGYNLPTGTSPDPADHPCVGSNLGSDDFACVTYALQDRTVDTFVLEAANNPTAIVVPRGEQFQNLNAQEYEYTVQSLAASMDSRVEAALELEFKSRLIPMFQFAVFYNKDLEILPGPNMTLAGPVHTNGDLYVGSHAALSILGQVTTAGDLYHGRKNLDTCLGGTVGVIDPVAVRNLPPCSGGTTEILPEELGPWNDMIRTQVDLLTVPPPEALDPEPDAVYWQKADLRVMLDLNGAPAIEVRNADGTTNAAATATLSACPGAAARSNAFYNHREATTIEMLDVDVTSLLDCIHDDLLIAGKDVNDATEGGLVFYFGVDGPDSVGLNNYGVRVKNGAELAATSALAPAVRGLTVVTNQAIYVAGHYNSVDKKPAAFLADSLNVLSRAWGLDWNDSHSAFSSRVARSTTINAAFLAGTDVTGGLEGPGGFDQGDYNGGVENYPRFHENWTSKTLTYRGSFVSLNAPLHVDGLWVYGGPWYTAPNRDWHYDTDFNDASKLPPLSPRFVHLKQELFIRRFEL